MLQGILRGEGRERVCRVRAVKVTKPDQPAHPAYADFDIIDSDDFPYGDYELLVVGQTILLAKREGEYVSRFG